MSSYWYSVHRFSFIQLSALELALLLAARTLVLHRDEITHRDVWRWRTSLIYDACDVGCCHKSLMYDLMMLPVWGNQ